MVPVNSFRHILLHDEAVVFSQIGKHGFRIGISHQLIGNSNRQIGQKGRLQKELLLVG